MGVPRRALVVTGHDDPMLPFLRRACAPDEEASIVPFFTDQPRSYSCTYSPTSEKLTLRTGDCTIEGTDIRSVWWRASVPPTLSNLRPELAEYCAREYGAFYEGLEALLPHATWVSKPSAIECARSKPRQLAAARALGFRVLDTIFTNNPSEIRKRAAIEPSVFKSIRSPRIPLDPDSHYTVFTTRLDAETISGVEGVASCPGIVQQFLEKSGDVRVTVIGNEVFGVFIDSQAAKRSSVDFRLGARDLAYRPHALSDADADRCRKLLQHLDLRYGAFDFGLTSTDELVFFEVNPNGQWGWLEEATSLPMRRALIDLLLHHQ